MIEPTSIQTIYQQGVPAFVVIPFQDFVREHPHVAKALACQKPRIPEGDAIPHEVVDLHVEKNIPLVRAWREYLGLTQNEVAARAGVTQAALSQMESGENKLRKASREKLAKAMGLNVEQVF
ncbi:helix-turn-helix domain-containing protein [Desulfonatronum sp. SC1]|uniref:helix-turn-helix domain-containing protein n=1 Tax=Desulfonatronum sp. SC1 TaxID=2109626 RepID=UPI000D310713|nr:helix-turn-helix transcriptional regulator [Desulfonatronum sp. SC1]PTN34497.1 transcriptional regulator [Desulfonatronum sp. SC1]